MIARVPAKRTLIAAAPERARESVLDHTIERRGEADRAETPEPGEGWRSWIPSD
jgi:hypothetical protein